MIGATGATGREVVRELLLLPNLSHMTLLVRKVNTTVIPTHDKIRQIEVNFDKLGFEFEEKKIGQHTFVASFLGTTKAAAGSSENYRKIEVDYPRDFARCARNVLCEHAILMSSDGANPSSMIGYLAQKGQVEEAWKKLTFDSLTIIRPGVLDRGDLKNTMEKVMGVFMTPMKCTTIALAVKHRIRDIIWEGMQKEVKEVVWRNGDITKWSEKLSPPVQFDPTSMGAPVNP